MEQVQGVCRYSQKCGFVSAGSDNGAGGISIEILVIDFRGMITLFHFILLLLLMALRYAKGQFILSVRQHVLNDLQRRMPTATSPRVRYVRREQFPNVTVVVQNAATSSTNAKLELQDDSTEDLLRAHEVGSSF